MTAAAGAGAVLVILAGSVGFGWWPWAPVGAWLRAHAVALVLAAFGVLLLGTAAVELRRGRRRRVAPAQRPPLSWWAILIGAVLVGTVSWAATAWLLAEASKAADPAAARVEAVKTGLGIGAGTGGVLALLLAVRRQWHQEVAAVDTVHDATERRVTELYAKAADQLGSDKAPVRLAGIYALERLAQDNVRLRQTVIDLLGAYLRMPFTPPSTDPPQAEPRQEREVRLTAQRVIAAHLHPGPDPDNPVDTFWRDMDLDLTGATLVNFDLSGCHLRTATFKAVTFVDDAEFLGTRFGGDAWFASTVFTGKTWFQGATFAGYAEFRSAEFTGASWFNSAVFADAADFNSVTFANVWFRSVTFTGHADFRSATFGGTANFDSATFTDNVDFDSATFAHRPCLSGARLPLIRYADVGTPPVKWIDLAGTRFAEGVPPELAALVPDEPPPA